MQQQMGQFVYLNGPRDQQQHMGQNVVVMATGTPLQQQFVGHEPQPQIVGQQTQQQFVVLTQPHVQTSSVPEINKTYQRTSSRVLGVMQIGLAVIMIGLNIGMAVLWENGAWFISTGWWATPFMIAAGCLGIVSGYRPTKCILVSTMAFSILSCACMIALFTQSGIGLSLGACVPMWWGCQWYQTDSNLALYILFILAGLTEVAVGVAQSVFCCKVLCCGKPVPQAFVTNQSQNYTNGGFMPYYVNSQGGATGQSIPMTNFQNNMQHVFMPTNNIPMATNNTMSTNDFTMPTTQTDTDPPAYSNEESEAF